MIAGNARAAELTRPRALWRNVLINTAGQIVPLLAALVSIPVLIHAIGPARFGVLSLVWMAVGYFNLFDFGLGRAATKLIAERLGDGRENEIPAVFWTTLALMLAVGAAGGLILAGLTPWLVASGLNIPAELQADARRSFLLISLAVPVMCSTAGLLGVIEAHQRFTLANAIRTPMGVFYYAGPLLVLPFSRELFPIVALLAGGRLVGWSLYFFACLRLMPALSRRPRLKRGVVASLMRLGGWMTVSNLVSPLMAALDRFLVAALISAEYVTYYATPYEMVTRILIVPAAFIGVFFPAFATTLAADRRHTVRLFQAGVKYLGLALFPGILLIVSFAGEVLGVWLGPELAARSTGVLQILGIGLFVNSLAHFPFVLLQGAGRPDITAKLHLAELPVYAAGMWALTRSFGIEGAALGWSLRVAADALLLFLCAQRFVDLPRWDWLRPGAVVLAAVAVLAAAAMAGADAAARAGLVTAALLGFIWWGWSRCLSPEERGALRRFLPLRSP